MKKTIIAGTLALAGWMVCANAIAHITPNVRLHTTRETINVLLPEGKLFIKDVKLPVSTMKMLWRTDNYDTHTDSYRFYISRNDRKEVLRVMTSITEFTRHGNLVVAVSLNPDGTVAEALVTDVAMELLTWVSPILKTDFLKSFRGKRSDMSLDLDDRWAKEFTGISHDFAKVIANAVKKSAQLFDVVFKK